jgi:hypothetical protein
MIIESTATILRAHPQYQLLLSAYRDHHERERAIQEIFDGWQSRINSLEGVEPELMCRIHGKLISLGLLKFELGDRMQGIRYQISTEARRVLSQLDQSSPETVEEDIFEEAA